MFLLADILAKYVCLLQEIKVNEKQMTEGINEWINEWMNE